MNDNGSFQWWPPDLQESATIPRQGAFIPRTRRGIQLQQYIAHRLFRWVTIIATIV